MVPVVTAVTADHRTPVIRLVAPWTDPDLIAPLIADLMLTWRSKNRGCAEKEPEEAR